ncbi:MAG: formyltransferase family protein, partial [Myxococcales bacterium]
MSATGPGASRATLLVSCRDRTGLVAALSDFVFRNGGNIIDADQHAELETGLFFMRLVWDLATFQLDRAGIDAGLAELKQRFDLSYELSHSDRRPRVAVFASKAPHCLYDLLLSHQLGELHGDLVLVVSNHDQLRPIAGHFGVRFEHVPLGNSNDDSDGSDRAPGRKAEAEAAQQRMLDEAGVDLVVLARYMQILSPAFV